ncbi:MAG: helix-turn-helix transcriptional regulator [Armatimonadetes bacterium]|nr:helix-turn-helix transcriptional regulator [Armatimonadota bacterium]
MDLSIPEGRRQQGLRIQAVAEAASLSLDELARQVGCSRALLYQYISGVTLAQPDKVQRIARAVNKPLSYFYAEDPDTPLLPAPAEVTADEPPPPIPAHLPEPAVPLVAEPPRWSEALARLEELAAAYVSPPDAWKEIAAGEQIISLARGLGDREAESRARLRVGNAQLRLGELEAARRSLELALAVCDRLPGASARAVSCAQSLGSALLGLGTIEEARAQFERVSKSDDWWGCWQGTLSLGAIHEQLGDYGQAIAAFAAAARVADAGPNARDRQCAHLYIRANLINAHLACGDHAAALEAALSCLTDAEALSDAGQAIEALLNAGLALYGLGRWGEAEQHGRRALQIAQLAGGPAHVSTARSCLALALSATGRFDAALQMGKDALDEGLRTGMVRCELLAHHALADAYLRAGTPRETLYHARRGAERAEALRFAYAAAQMRMQEAESLRRSGSLAQARDGLAHALDRAVGAGMRGVQAEALLSLACLGFDEGTPEKAREHASDALSLAREMESPDLAWRAQWLLGRAAESPKERLEPWEAAVREVERLRRLTRAHVGEEALLEEPERLMLYQDLVKALRESARETEADEFLQRTHWPPLLQALARSEAPEGER